MRYTNCNSKIYKYEDLVRYKLSDLDLKQVCLGELIRFNQKNFNNQTIKDLEVYKEYICSKVYRLYKEHTSPDFKYKTYKK